MQPILLLGDPRLRAESAPVTRFEETSFGELASTLESFRAAHGFGRAISAPQIGVAQRFIAVDLGRGPFFIVNPVVTWKSAETFTMWDDCMSFPDLLVRVRRSSSISIDYVDEHGRPKQWLEMERPVAELLQHEIDHLDGILAVDRAEGPEPIILRDAYAANREYHDARVDYTIVPTIA